MLFPTTFVSLMKKTLLLPPV